MNLETKLNDCLNEVLRSAGYMFEVMNKNKKQSNFITGANNQLIPPIITAQLGSSISKFDDLLDETTLKFDYAKWCVGSILESRQKQVELKLKEEEQRQKKLKKEEERKRKEEEELVKRKEQEEKRLQELERIKLQQQQETKKERDRLAKQEAEKQAEKQAKQDNDLFDDFITGDFDFNMDMGMNTSEPAKVNSNSNTNPNPPPNSNLNPLDILSNIDYDLGFDTKQPEKPTKETEATKETHKDKNFDKELDLDINNILGNNDLILDGLNMGLLDQGDDFVRQTNNLEEDFDVDNFLNQFAGDD